MKRLIATIIALAVFLGVAFNVEKKQEESKNKAYFCEKKRDNSDRFWQIS